KSLTQLYLFDNTISDVKFVLDLPLLQEISLSGNPVIELNKGTKDFSVADWCNFYRQLEGDRAFLYEAKILLVGEPEAGKTSLTNKLLDPTHDIRQDSGNSTLGIDIHANWTFPHPKDPVIEFRAHLWDCGGQNIQYHIHQFFLTEDAVYLLLLDNRKEYPNLDYWFHIIDVLGKNSPVIVVGNQKEINAEIGFDWPDYLRRFDKQFPELLYHKLNLADDPEKLADLHRDVQRLAASLPHVGQERPAGWIKVREKIAEERIERPETPYLTQKEFRAICVGGGVVQAEYQDQLCRYLHVLGIILHYRHDPTLSDLIFINPMWVTRAVYQILGEKKNDIQAQQGMFQKSWLYKEWGTNYQAEDKDKLLLLMQKKEFDLIYPVGDRDEHYMVPLLLSTVTPDEAQDWHNGRRALNFRYRYAFMPEGLVNRLIVRLFQLIERNTQGKSLIWRNGAILTKNSCQARVWKRITKEGLQAIDISVIGADAYARKELLGHIRITLENIQKNTFPDLPVEMMIPCCCENCRNSDDPNLFEVSRLENRIKGNKATIDCEKWSPTITPVSIKELLMGVLPLQKIADRDKEELVKQVDKMQDEMDIIRKLYQESRFVHQEIIVNGPAQINNDAQKPTQPVGPPTPGKKGFLERLKNILTIPKIIIAIIIGVFTIYNLCHKKPEVKPPSTSQVITAPADTVTTDSVTN
ncbi:hypothetical protein KAH55_12055, partial [bacterium]|nr:hypothetical protein [bacterium]